MGTVVSLDAKTWRAFSARSREMHWNTLLSIQLASTVIKPSRNYANRTNYRVRAPKVTAFADVETLYFTDINSTTAKKHDTKISLQVARHNLGDLQNLAVDRGYDAKAFRDEFRDNGVRRLIKHRIMDSLDHAHNARMDSDRYH